MKIRFVTMCVERSDGPLIAIHKDVKCAQVPRTPDHVRLEANGAMRSVCGVIWDHDSGSAIVCLDGKIDLSIVPMPNGWKR